MGLQKPAWSYRTASARVFNQVRLRAQGAHISGLAEVNPYISISSFRYRAAWSYHFVVADHVWSPAQHHSESLFWKLNRLVPANSGCLEVPGLGCLELPFHCCR